MELITTAVAFLRALLASILARQAGEEFKSWTPWLVQRLIHRAILRLPEEARERLSEEWQGHLREVPGEVGKLVVAFGFLQAASKIRELCQAPRNPKSSAEIAMRAFDVVFSCVAILVMAPVLCVLSLVIKIAFGGPIFLVTERVGSNGNTFKMYRFRTRKHADRSETARLSPNVVSPDTIVMGNILCRTSLHELPLIFNVLKGDLSLVGPRSFPSA